MSVEFPNGPVDPDGSKYEFGYDGETDGWIQSTFLRNPNHRPQLFSTTVCFDMPSQWARHNRTPAGDPIPLMPGDQPTAVTAINQPEPANALTNEKNIHPPQPEEAREGPEKQQQPQSPHNTQAAQVTFHNTNAAGGAGSIMETETSQTQNIPRGSRANENSNPPIGGQFMRPSSKNAPVPFNYNHHRPFDPQWNAQRKQRSYQKIPQADYQYENKYQRSSHNQQQPFNPSRNMPGPPEIQRNNRNSSNQYGSNYLPNGQQMIPSHQMSNVPSYLVPSNTGMYGPAPPLHLNVSQPSNQYGGDQTVHQSTQPLAGPRVPPLSAPNNSQGILGPAPQLYPDARVPRVSNQYGRNQLAQVDVTNQFDPRYCKSLYPLPGQTQGVLVQQPQTEPSGSVQQAQNSYGTASQSNQTQSYRSHQGPPSNAPSMQLHQSIPPGINLSGNMQSSQGQQQGAHPNMQPIPRNPSMMPNSNQFVPQGIRIQFSHHPVVTQKEPQPQIPRTQETTSNMSTGKNAGILSTGYITIHFPHDIVSIVSASPLPGYLITYRDNENNAASGSNRNGNDNERRPPIYPSPSITDESGRNTESVSLANGTHHIVIAGGNKSIMETTESSVGDIKLNTVAGTESLASHHAKVAATNVVETPIISASAPTTINSNEFRQTDDQDQESYKRPLTALNEPAVTEPCAPTTSDVTEGAPNVAENNESESSASNKIADEAPPQTYAQIVVADLIETPIMFSTGSSNGNSNEYHHTGGQVQSSTEKMLSLNEPALQKSEPCEEITVDVFLNKSDKSGSSVAEHTTKTSLNVETDIESNSNAEQKTENSVNVENNTESSSNAEIIIVQPRKLMLRSIGRMNRRLRAEKKPAEISKQNSKETKIENNIASPVNQDNSNEHEKEDKRCLAVVLYDPMENIVSKIATVDNAHENKSAHLSIQEDCDLTDTSVKPVTSCESVPDPNIDIVGKNKKTGNKKKSHLKNNSDAKKDKKSAKKEAENCNPRPSILEGGVFEERSIIEKKTVEEKAGTSQVLAASKKQEKKQNKTDKKQHQTKQLENKQSVVSKEPSSSNNQQAVAHEAPIGQVLTVSLKQFRAGEFPVKSTYRHVKYSLDDEEKQMVAAALRNAQPHLHEIFGDQADTFGDDPYRIALKCYIYQIVTDKIRSFALDFDIGESIPKKEITFFVLMEKITDYLRSKPMKDWSSEESMKEYRDFLQKKIDRYGKTSKQFSEKQFSKHLLKFFEIIGKSNLKCFVQDIHFLRSLRENKDEELESDRVYFSNFIFLTDLLAIGQLESIIPHPKTVCNLIDQPLQPQYGYTLISYILRQHEKRKEKNNTETDEMTQIEKKMLDLALKAKTDAEVKFPSMTISFLSRMWISLERFPETAETKLFRQFYEILMKIKSNIIDIDVYNFETVFETVPETCSLQRHSFILSLWFNYKP